MFGDRLKRYKGLLILITTLIGFIIVVVAGGAYVDSNLVQRETFARAKSVNFVDMLLRFGGEDQQLREDIYQHLVMYRDGGRLATPFGPAWDYPAVQSEEFRKPLLRAMSVYESGTPKEFEEAFFAFDRSYADIVLGRQKLLVAAQYIAAGIVFLGFLWILAILFFRLGRADDIARALRRENDNIMASTKEGMFLIDRDFLIGEQRSAAVADLFGENANLGGNFLNFLENHVSDKELQRAKKYLGLVFGGRVKPKLMGDLNPLTHVEFFVNRRLGGTLRRVLSFDFSRDAQAENVDNLLVTITDISKEVALREELDATKEIQNERLTLLKGVMHVEPEQLDQYLKKSSATYEEINELLADGGEHEDNLDRLGEIARITHRLKGDAAALKLPLFESSLHRFEDKISELQQRKVVDGQSLLTLVVHLKNMIAELDLASTLSGYFGSGVSDETNNVTRPASVDDVTQDLTIGFAEKLSALAQTVADREGKSVSVTIGGLEVLQNHPHAVEFIYDVAVQLIRNSVVHGIEKDLVRLEQNKLIPGEIKVLLKERDELIELEVLDNGAGLDFDEIRKKAISVGLLTAEDAVAIDKKGLLGCLFSPKFSLRDDDVSNDAGRGVGLDVVRSQVNDRKGRISVRSVLGKYTQFLIYIPNQVNGES